MLLLQDKSYRLSQHSVDRRLLRPIAWNFTNCSRVVGWCDPSTDRRSIGVASRLCAQALWAPTAGNSAGVRTPHASVRRRSAATSTVATDEEWRSKRPPCRGTAARRRRRARDVAPQRLPESLRRERTSATRGSTNDRLARPLLAHRRRHGHDGVAAAHRGERMAGHAVGQLPHTEGRDSPVGRISTSEDLSRHGAAGTRRRPKAS